MSFQLTRRSWLAGVAALSVLPAFARAPWPAQAAVRPAFAPRPSDVCFSSRFGYMKDLAPAKAFGANRLDWCYAYDAKFVAQARGQGVETFGGAINSTLSDSVGGVSSSIGRITSREGARVLSPYHVKWDRAAGCINAPQYRAIFLEHARAQLDIGMEWFLFDGATFNLDSVRWPTGGCFCRYCRAAAGREGLDIERDQEELQRRSSIAFYRLIRPRLDELAGRHVTVAVNNFAMGTPANARWLHDEADFGMSEVDAHHLDLGAVADVVAKSEARGWPQIFTLRSGDVDLNRRFAAWCYAHGTHMLAPWDVYMTNDTPRAFLPADRFTDIFQFARTLGSLLDDAVRAEAPPADAWTSTLPGVETSLRVDPRSAFAAFHLVAWAKEGRSTVSIDPAQLLPDGRRVAAARLHTPGGEIAFQSNGGLLVADAPPATWMVAELEVA